MSMQVEQVFPKKAINDFKVLLNKLIRLCNILYTVTMELTNYVSKDKQLVISSEKVVLFTGEHDNQGDRRQIALILQDLCNKNLIHEVKKRHDGVVIYICNNVNEVKTLISHLRNEVIKLVNVLEMRFRFYMSEHYGKHIATYVNLMKSFHKFASEFSRKLKIIQTLETIDAYIERNFNKIRETLLIPISELNKETLLRNDKLLQLILELGKDGDRELLELECGIYIKFKNYEALLKFIKNVRNMRKKLIDSIAVIKNEVE